MIHLPAFINSATRVVTAFAKTLRQEISQLSLVPQGFQKGSRPLSVDTGHAFCLGVQVQFTRPFQPSASHKRQFKIRRSHTGVGSWLV